MTDEPKEKCVTCGWEPNQQHYWLVPFTGDDAGKSCVLCLNKARSALGFPRLNYVEWVKANGQ